MRYIKQQLENILKEKISYTTEVKNLYYIYNYRIENQDFVVLTLKLSDELFILELIILPNKMRKNGLGSQIVDMLKRWAYENDYKKIHLTAIHNSKRFWEKQQFIDLQNSLQMEYPIKK